MKDMVVEIVAGIILAVAATLIVALPRPVECQSCIATFCGSTAECNRGCFCAIEMGDATGHCVGSR